MSVLLHRFLSLKSIPIERMLLITRGACTVWEKTHVTKSRYCVGDKLFADAPYFQKKSLRPGTRVYVDGLRRLFLLDGRRRSEIQFGPVPYCYYGEQLRAIPDAHLTGIDANIKNGYLVEGDADQLLLEAMFSDSKLVPTARVKQDFLVLREDPFGRPYDAENHALWPDKCPAMRDFLEVCLHA